MKSELECRSMRLHEATLHIRRTLECDPSKVGEYERKWSELKAAYRHIRLYRCKVGSIGYTIATYFAMCEENTDPDTLYVILPSAKDFAGWNMFAHEYMGICDREETLFWLYIIDFHTNEVELDEIDKFDAFNVFPPYLQPAGSVPAHFTEEQRARGEERLAEMGLERPFVCFAARNESFHKNLQKAVGIIDSESVGNASFNAYGKAIAWLGDKGVRAAKMGRLEPAMEPMPNCVDYAGLYSDDFMDLYAASECEFFVGGASGVSSIPRLFTKPLLLVNIAPLNMGFGAIRYTEHDRFLPKKFFDRNQNKYLSFRGIFAWEKQLIKDRQDSDIRYYRSKGIELYENSEDELLEAVQEMKARVEGTWEDTPEDRENYERYRSIFNEMITNKTDAIPVLPAATFLRRNRYLLE